MAKSPGKKTTGRPNRGVARRKLGNRRRKRLEAESLNYTAGVLRRAYVVFVHPADMTVDLQVTQGPNNKPYKNIPVSFGACGSRTFMGVMPELNDQCIVGFAPSTLMNTRPYIVAWIPNAPRMGRDWVPVSIFSTEEVEGLGTPKIRNQVGPYAPLIRNKAPRLNEGNAFISSSQGADLALDESVTLANRRGNEIILRDQDQAIVMRSLQQFHAGSGFRVYGGQVQRDTMLLPRSLFADRHWWDAPGQTFSSGEDVRKSQLPTDGPRDGTLEPAHIYQRNAANERMHGTTATGNTSSILDPYNILERGLYIDADGNLLGGVIGTAYGGCPVYRCSTSNTNGFATTDDTFTEYRIEVSHTSDGTLPVTEQTDGFEIDRLPLSASSIAVEVDGEKKRPPPIPSENVPFVEMVMGTYIGNDAFGKGAALYGLPICPQLFASDGSLAPGLVSAAGKPTSEQAAWIVVVQNPNDMAQDPSWMAITKGGAFRSHFTGHGSPTAEAIWTSGKKETYGGEGLTLESTGSLDLKHTDGSDANGFGINVDSAAAVRIHGGASSATKGASDPSAEEPSVVIDAVTNLHQNAPGTLKQSCGKLLVEDCEIESHTVSSAIKFRSGDQFCVNAKSGSYMWTGDCTQNYGGKRDGFSSNSSCLVETFSANAATGILGANNVRETSIQMGAWECTGPLAKESHVYKVGSISFKGTGTGDGMSSGFGSGVRVGSGVGSQDNSTSHKPTSIKTVGYTGNISVKAVAGSNSLTSTLSTTIKAATKLAAKATLITLDAPGVFSGACLTSGCIDNLTGKSFGSSGTVGYSTVKVG